MGSNKGKQPHAQRNQNTPYRTTSHFVKGSRKSIHKSTRFIAQNPENDELPTSISSNPSPFCFFHRARCPFFQFFVSFVRRFVVASFCLPSPCFLSFFFFVDARADLIMQNILSVVNSVTIASSSTPCRHGCRCSSSSSCRSCLCKVCFSCGASSLRRAWFPKAFTCLEPSTPFSLSLSLSTSAVSIAEM